MVFPYVVETLDELILLTGILKKLLSNGNIV